MLVLVQMDMDPHLVRDILPKLQNHFKIVSWPYSFSQLNPRRKIDFIVTNIM